MTGRAVPGPGEGGSGKLIRGITLTHPWAWAISRAGKDVENRTWRPERQGGRVGMYLAIHGGAVPTGRTARAEEARMALWEVLTMTGRSGSFTEGELAGLSSGIPAVGEQAFFTPGIVAVATLAFVTDRSTSLWAVDGQYHWGLADVVTLPEPVPHRGAQGLWEVAPEALEQVRAGWKRAQVATS